MEKILLYPIFPAAKKIRNFSVYLQNVHDVKRNTEEKKPSNNLSGVQVALGWNRPDFAERLLKADNSCKDELALGSILLHAMVFVCIKFSFY